MRECIFPVSTSFDRYIYSIRYYHANPEKIWFSSKRSKRNLHYLTLTNSIRAIVAAIRTIFFTWTNLKYKSNWDKVGCPIVINSLLPHAEFRLNDHRETQPTLSYCFHSLTSILTIDANCVFSETISPAVRIFWCAFSNTFRCSNRTISFAGFIQIWNTAKQIWKLISYAIYLRACWWFHGLLYTACYQTKYRKQLQKSHFQK